MNNDLIEGIVNTVIYTNIENGYAVLRLQTDDGLITATGCIPGITPGERLVLSGQWMTHHQYGEQFNAETFELLPPSSAEDVFRYLASGVIKGIGPAKARDIVEKFGPSALAVIENEPESLAVIKGISKRAALKIGENYRRLASLRRLIDFLAKYGIKPLAAIRAYKYYGESAIDALHDNPYILTNEAFGVEFFEADSVALDLGFESDCSQRVSAAIIFVLTHNLGNGHVFIPRSKLISATDQLIGAGHEIIADALDALNECGDIVIEAIAGEEGCYLRQMHDAEHYTAKRILEMSSKSYTVSKLESDIQEIETRHGIKYAPEQKTSLGFAAKHGVMALTGGPGTGKTTTVRGILFLFDSLDLKTMLCAPTGRAAKRLSETCMREAATIHRMLGAKPNDEGMLVFSHNEDNPLRADAIIVDETSMVDISLMHSLLQALEPECRLIMIGDADQLPSVGPGNVFADIIKSDIVPTVRLTKIFRQAENSGIVKCSHDVNKGIMPDFTVKYPDLFFIKRRSEEQITDTVTELYAKRLPENMGIDPSQIQVLSPTRKRAAGTVTLNMQLREAVNPGSAVKKEKQFGTFLFRIGDKVMQIKNNYDIMWFTPDMESEQAGVFNGDIGTVKEIDHSRETVTIDYEDKIVDYLYEQLLELEPAFAMTVHKSQGSEYPAVILAMTNAAPQLLSRSVLYTAMTRAKSLLVIVGNPDVLEKMVHNDKRQRRYSGLRFRLVSTYAMPVGALHETTRLNP